FYNFAHLPVVTDIDDFWRQKQKKLNHPEQPQERKPYEDIHMPKNTAAGLVISIFAFVFSFAMVWHIWWLSVLGLIGVLISLIMRSFNYNTDYYLSAREVEAIEMKHHLSMAGR
ncbi:MAG: cytochrome o ubiquinol oxidase subunit I, partial [bacterium]|nr:cytochrome o ubiquinol oxidase subunit I [bacterium]